MPLTDVLAGETPGASLIIWRKSRPFIGRSATVLVFTTPTSAVEVVSRVAAVAETSTTCCCCATPSCRSRFVVLETATSTRSIFRDSKPACETVIGVLADGEVGEEILALGIGDGGAGETGGRDCQA